MAISMSKKCDHGDNDILELFLMLCSKCCLLVFFSSNMAAPPSVSNVRIVGDAVEGSIIKGIGDYFGGREGPSKFEWLRENRDSGSVFFYSSLVICAFANWKVNCCIYYSALGIGPNSFYQNFLYLISSPYFALESSLHCVSL